MPRLSPTTDVVRALFARSGNQCAFPGCTESLIDEKNQFIGQLCHIEAALPKGERFNPKQSDEERRAYENLILLCYPHHIETNNTAQYSVKRIRKIKYEQESKFEKNLYKIDEAVLYKIIFEMEMFWDKIETLNKFEHLWEDFAIEINSKSSFFAIMAECHEYIGNLQEFFDILCKSEMTPFSNWEIHNLGVPNVTNRLCIHLKHLEIKYLEEYLKTNLNDPAARNRLDSLKKEFEEIAQTAVVVD